MEILNCYLHQTQQILALKENWRGAFRVPLRSPGVSLMERNKIRYGFHLKRRKKEKKTLWLSSIGIGNFVMKHNLYDTIFVDHSKSSALGNYRFAPDFCSMLLDASSSSMDSCRALSSSLSAFILLRFTHKPFFRPKPMSVLSASLSSSAGTSISSDPSPSKAIHKPPAQPWLIVGLGNPGKRYNSTRHNVGFEMVVRIAESEGISMTNVSFKAIFGKG